MNLIIRSATLPNGDQAMDIVNEGGRITAAGSTFPVKEPQEIDAV